MKYTKVYLFSFVPHCYCKMSISWALFLENKENIMYVFYQTWVKKLKRKKKIHTLCLGANKLVKQFCNFSEVVMK